MKYLLTAFFLLTSACAHDHVVKHAPPSAGFFGLVRPHRPVICWNDKDMTPAHCELVRQAVAEIDLAVGYELLHYAGLKNAKPTDKIGPDFEEQITLVGSDDLPSNIGGITKPLAGHAGYLGTVLTVYNISLWDLSPTIQYNVVIHELCHSVGMFHAADDSMFPTEMRPVVDPKVTGLTPADIEALRDAYSR